jgi:dethiobiotin synthetase
VGKTWVGCELARRASGQGLRVTARKMAQSFALGDTGLDAERLALATGDDVRRVCPQHRSYEIPMAPPMAAAALGRAPFVVADLLGELDWPSPAADIGLLEQAGGVGSPQADDGDGIEVARLLAPDAVVLVARAGLGTLSDVSLAARALSAWAGVRRDRLVVFLNRFDRSDGLHSANRDWLTGVVGVRVVTDAGSLLEGLLEATPVL